MSGEARKLEGRKKFQVKSFLKAGIWKLTIGFVIAVLFSSI